MKTLLSIATVTLLVSAMALATTTKKIDQHFKVEQGQRIEIKGFSGSHIQFRSWDKPDLYIRLDISISGSDEKYEKTFLDGIKIEERRSPDMLSISFDDASKTIEHSTSFWTGLRSLVGLTRSVSREVEGEIFVPAANDLSAHIPYATVSRENME